MLICMILQSLVIQMNVVSVVNLESLVAEELIPYPFDIFEDSIM